MKKIAKLGAFASTLFSLPYLLAMPILADETVNPCGAGNFTALCKKTTVAGLIGTIINLTLFVAFIAALVFLIYGGIRWIISGGDKEGTAKAKGTVTSALIGLAIVLGSWILINLILQLFGVAPDLTKLVFPSLPTQ